MNNQESLKQSVLKYVNKVPYGKVTSFGEIGRVTGCSGWQVGRVLTGLGESDWGLYAWQRIVSKSGFISSLKLGFKGELQKALLEKEGVVVNENIVDQKFFFYFEP